MTRNDRTICQSAAAVAAALLVAAIALGSPGNSHAQTPPKDQRAQKKAPFAKGPIPPRKGPLAVGPNRFISPHRPALGPGALPQGARIAPNRDPRFNTFNKGPAAGPANARFGNSQPGNRVLGTQPGNRALGNQPRGFTHRDPRLRAVNARTPQLRQVQRTTHRAELFAIRSRMPVRA